MKKTLLIPVLMVLFLFVSCRVSENYTFLNPSSEIAEVSIVELSFDDNRELIQTELKRIENTEVFLEDFRSIDCYVYFGDPVPATPEGTEATVIKILYQNDEYELINYNGQSEYTAERGLKYYAGYSAFDAQQFKALIEKYASAYDTGFRNKHLSIDG